MLTTHLSRGSLPPWVLAAVPPEDVVTAIQPAHYLDGGDRVLVTGAAGSGRGEYSLRQPLPTASKTAVVHARVPAALADRLHAASASLGTGASALLRSLLERGLADFEASDALKIPDAERREKFIQGRLTRKQKAAAQATPIAVGADGLNDVERATAETLTGAHRDRFVASRKARRGPAK